MVNLINLIVWLSAGVVIGWCACRMVQMEQRPPHVQHNIEES
jgi:hypothetical protein